MTNEHRNAPRVWWICVALAAITLALFSPVFHYAFLTFDDQLYVTENPYVRSGLNFNSMAWAFQTSTSGNWLPLTWLSHMLDFECYGLNAGGHHLTNVLFHAVNTVLLFLVLRKMTGALWRSAMVAALFAWHPAHVESVAWIAERKDVLSAFFGLLTLWTYAGYAQGTKHRKILYLSTVALFACGLMAKPMLVTLPFVLLLLDFWPLGRMSRAAALRLVVEKTPLFLLSAACCAWTLWAQEKGNAVASAGELPFGHRLGHVLVSYLQYIGMLVFPRDLAIFYPYPLHEQTGLIIGGALVLIGLCGLAIVLGKRRPWVAVGWLWFAGMLVPVIGLVQAGGQAMADRYTYLPAIGLFIMVAWGGAELAGRFPGVKWVAPIVGAVMLAATWRQIHYWKDPRTVFERARAVTPDNFLALTLLGSIRADDGQEEEAMKLYREALHDNPNYPEAHFFFARGLEHEGRLDQAQAEYIRAVRLKPEFQQAHIFLGLLLAREKQYDRATEEYEAVLKINPRSAVAHNDLARVLQTEGRLDESIRHYVAALQYDSSLAQAHNNLGVLYLQNGQSAGGLTELREALRLDPNNTETEYNLALALTQAQQWKEALALLQRLAPARPLDANAQYQYGLALSHQGKTREAMGQYAQAILLTPNFAAALNELAWILATNPHPEWRNGGQAVEMAERACELTGHQQPAMLLTLAAAYAEAGRFNEALITIEKGGEIARVKGNKEVEAQAALMRNAFTKQHSFRASELTNQYPSAAR